VVPQTVNFTFGLFGPTGDVDLTNVLTLFCNAEFTIETCESEGGVDPGDFQSFTFGGEWLLPIGNFVEFGAGVSYAKGTVESFYRDYVDMVDNTNIEQELSLRQIPLAFTVRALPFSQSRRFQPYVGGGLGISFWKYSEAGDLIDFSTLEIYDSSVPPDVPKEGDGTSTGFIFLAGARYATERFTVGGELRRSWADGDLDPDIFSDPAVMTGTPKIHLGGWTFQATVGARF
jgi:opacity protein-like surface antigen